MMSQPFSAHFYSNWLDQSIFELACENRLATFGAPDEMIGEQVYPVLIALVVHLAILIG